jgi:putative FmdB family regulatory protein
MPTYDYVCKVCSNEFEIFQKMNEPPLEKCPQCGGKVNRKIGGGAGLLFKGSGFYITDYKGNSEKTKKEEPKKTKAQESSKKEDLSSKS